LGLYENYNKGEIMKRKDYIICPNCRRKIDYFIHWQKVDVGYAYDIASGSWEQTKDGDAEHISYDCPECGEGFSREFADYIDQEVIK